MWEVIRKNKIKSAVAFCVMAVWYWIAIGLFLFFMTFIFMKNLIFSFCAAFSISLILGILEIFIENIAINNKISNFYIWENYYFFTDWYNIRLYNNAMRQEFSKENFYKIYKYVNYDDFGCTDGSCIKDIQETNSRCQMLYNVVEELSIASGLHIIPSLYLVNTDCIVNSCSCGTNPKNSSIFITKGLLKLLTRDELQCVVAHEMSHIINRDTIYLLYSASSPLKFISKSREYLADAYACQYTRNPKGLANALNKIKNYKILNNWYPASNLLKASFIVPVFIGKNNWNSTHPPTEKRIQILKSMTSADYVEYEKQYQKLTNKKLIPESELKNSKKLEIKKSQEKAMPLDIVTACALNETVQNKEQIKTIKENKNLIKENIQKHREVEDFVRDLANYTVITCECGTKLKIPPVYKNAIIICPHCKKKHLMQGTI